MDTTAAQPGAGGRTRVTEVTGTVLTAVTAVVELVLMKASGTVADAEGDSGRASVSDAEDIDCGSDSDSAGADGDAKEAVVGLARAAADESIEL
jgi:hypothetical protein